MRENISVPPLRAPAAGDRLGPTIADFRDVDASDPAALIAYLDAVARNLGEEKRKSFEALRAAQGMAVLDVGCGTGDDVRALATLVGPEGRVCGVDASTAMIAEARRRGVPQNVEFVIASADALPLATASFDAVRAERVFQHLREPERAAAELRRVVRDGGRAFAVDPDWETLIVSGADADLARTITRALVDRLANPFAGRNALGLLRRAGFRTVVAAPVVSSPTLAPAHDLFLASAIDASIDSGVVTKTQAAAWLSTLAEAEGRGEFFCAVLSVATLATA